MASISSINRKLGLVLACLAAVGFGCDDDHAADHDDEPDAHSHAGTTGSTAGTGGEHSHDGAHAQAVGPLTGAKCPSSGSTLTYENFARKFVADYCLSCHGEELTGAARHKAPEDHNFDTYADVDLMRNHIDQKAGSGPDHTNTAMPPVDAAKKPTMEERQKLSEWIACGDPEK